MEPRMSFGPSGRIVVEIEPELKRRLYSELAQEGLTLKTWLIGQAERYISDRRQPLLFAAEPRIPYGTRSSER
jgi:hypothetical protein